MEEALNQLEESRRINKVLPDQQQKDTSTVVQFGVDDLDLFDEELQQNLENIALNQLNFFRKLQLHYPLLLKYKKYNQREGNTEVFWKIIIAEYEVCTPSSQILSLV